MRFGALMERGIGLKCRFEMFVGLNKAESAHSALCRKDGKGVMPICDRLGVVSSGAEVERRRASDPWRGSDTGV